MTTTILWISAVLLFCTPLLMVATEELFRAWREKHITRPIITIARPSLQEGERYVGAIIPPDLTGYHLIRMPLDPDWKLKWKAAMTFAAEEGCKLPDRPEAALLFATRETAEFAEEWYWTREQHAGDDDFAWCQDFGYGYQSDFHKDGQYRVVLVRRVPFTL